MKKLNRKGFTLVELLAVIVILAIVVGITLVTVLPTLQKTRQEAFALTANTAAEYLEKQYQIYLVGDLAGDSSDLDFTGSLVSETTGSDVTGATISTADFTKAGLKAGNYKSGTWYINTKTGRACVKLTALTNKNNNNNGGEYYDADPDSVSSTGCNAG